MDDASSLPPTMYNWSQRKQTLEKFALGHESVKITTLNVFYMYFDFWLWSVSHPFTGKRWDLWPIVQPGSNEDTLALLLGSRDLVYLFIQSMLWTGRNQDVERWANNCRLNDLLPIPASISPAYRNCHLIMHFNMHRAWMHSLDDDFYS